MVCPIFKALVIYNVNILSFICINMFTLLPALLIIHLLGFTLMAGTTLVEFVNYKFFWKAINQPNQQATGILAAMEKSSKLIGLGAMLQILSGIGMVTLTHGAFAAQLWFKIKMLLVLLLIVNGILNGNKISAKIRNAVDLQEAGLSVQLNTLKDKLNTFYIFQMIIFLCIVILSAYKFN